MTSEGAGDAPTENHSHYEASTSAIVTLAAYPLQDLPSTACWSHYTSSRFTSFPTMKALEDTCIQYHNGSVHKAVHHRGACGNEVPVLQHRQAKKNGAMAHPGLDPVLHLARPIVGGVGLGIAVRGKGRGARIECGKALHEDGVLGSTVEEHNEHCGCEAGREGDFMFVHGCWREPVKDALPCNHHRVSLCLLCVADRDYGEQFA